MVMTESFTLHHTPEAQAVLDTPLAKIVDPSSYMMTRTVALARNGQYRRRGYGPQTLRDALVIGERGIAAINGVDSMAVRRLRGNMTRVFPEVALPERADPLVIARVCPALGKVSARCLGPSALGIGPDTDRMPLLRPVDTGLETDGKPVLRPGGYPSVADFLTRTQSDLFCGDLDGSDLQWFNAQVTAAQNFAVVFNTVRFQLGLPAE